MNDRDLKKNIIYFSRNNQEIIAGFVAILAFSIAVTILFAHEKVGVIDYGEYTQTLYDMGLSYTKETKMEEESQRYLEVIEKYNVDNIKILQLLQLKPSQSLIYPVSMISIICKLLHIYFSTRYLAFLFMVITVMCIYSITKSAYYYLKEKAAAVGIACCFVFLCGNYIIYFNSLYRNGIYIVSMLAFLSILLHIVASGKKGNRKAMLLLMGMSLLLLNSKETMIVYLPIVIIADVCAMFYCRPEKEKRISYYVFFLLLLCFVVRSNILYTLDNQALFSNTQLYHSFFTGVLEESDNPEELLVELGLDPSLSADIGKNAYLSSENYVIDPNGEQAQEEIFSHLSYSTLWKLYLKHPGIYIKILTKTAKNLKEIDTYRFLNTKRLANEGTEWVELFVWWQWIRLFIVPNSLAGYLIVASLSFLLLGLLLYLKRKDREKRSLILLGYLAWFISFFQYITIYTWQGYAEINSINYYFIFTFDINIIFLFGFLVKGYEVLRRKYFLLLPEYSKEKSLEEQRVEEQRVEEQRVEEQLTEEQLTEENIIEVQLMQEICVVELVESEEDVREELFLENPIGGECRQIIAKTKKCFVTNILSHPNRAALFFSGISIGIVVGVLFYPSRIGAYNNGDFGRMMTAMNIQYTALDWENPDELALTKVVEKYDWIENYDYSKLLPHHADLSQIWFSFPLKIIDNFFGLTFSTVYVTIMYSILIIISIFFIMQVLFHRFGPNVFWLAVVLLFVLLDLVNLGWLNSLFGEGIAFVSLLMIVASALKIADMKRGICRFSFLFLLFPELLFTGAKAQFTLTTPVVLIGTVLLFWYHRPKGWWKKIPYFIFLFAGSIWISISAISVYHNNSYISSPDTIYQSIFYGLLMLVDNPEETLTELGLDPAMAVDTGKHAYLDKSEYYCAPRTDKAEEMLYSKVSTVDVLFYYIKHPKLFWRILDITTSAAAEDMPNYIILVGQKTTQEPDAVERFHLWGTTRSYLVCHHFWELLVIYGIDFIFTFKYLINKEISKKDKMLLSMFFMISFIGILQFPLTFIGNGFADNTKQLYLFRLTYDLTVFTGIYLIIPLLRRLFNKLKYSDIINTRE